MCTSRRLSCTQGCNPLQSDHHSSSPRSEVRTKRSTDGKESLFQMTAFIQSVADPELFFGIVAPIGTDVETTIGSLSASLSVLGYRPIVIRVTDTFYRLEKYLSFPTPLCEKPLETRYLTYIEFGDNLRKHFSDDSFIASIAISSIARERAAIIAPGSVDPPQKIAYIVRQFKRREEIDLLRSVYGSLFFQISVNSKRSARVDNLSSKIASSHNSVDANSYRGSAEGLVRKDDHETEDVHGQRVTEIFHDADFIVNSDLSDPSVGDQINRFIDLIFGSNSLSPTKMEYGMYAARSASLRTLDLSRQVGAAIFTQSGEIICQGTNEVPKAGGGTYWCDDPHDDRDYKRKQDSNVKRKRELISELIELLVPDEDISSVLKDRRIDASQFMDALEYGRIIHAEMSAICDAARLGRSLKGSILFCTTFPCHMCAKHIVASGILEVVFLEPYPKSMARELHGDSISIEGQYRGDYSAFPSVNFRAFHGVSPRRYRDLFERKKRKNDLGVFQPWKKGTRTVIVDIKLPVYLQLEGYVINAVLDPSLGRAGISLDVLWEGGRELTVPT